MSAGGDRGREQLREAWCCVPGGVWALRLCSCRRRSNEKTDMSLGLGDLPRLGALGLLGQVYRRLGHPEARRIPHGVKAVPDSAFLV